MSDRGRDGPTPALISDWQLEQATRAIARDCFPQPGAEALRPQLISLVAQPAPGDEQLAIEIFDIDQFVDRGDSQTAVYLYTIGRIVARSHRYPVVAYLLFERPLCGLVDPWSLAAPVVESLEQRQVQLLGLAIDGRISGAAALIERNPHGIVAYSSELASLDPQVKGTICDDTLCNLREFWHGFMEVIVDQFRH